MIKILLAEDDNNLGSLLRDYLKVKNYSTILYPDGEKAWEAFNTEHFDLCLLDVMMPKTDGITLARRIREKNREIHRRIDVTQDESREMKKELFQKIEYLTDMQEEQLRRIKKIERIVNDNNLTTVSNE